MGESMTKFVLFERLCHSKTIIVLFGSSVSQSSHLDAAFAIGDMNFPGSGLHLLEPKRKSIWAVKVSGNWRITFGFKEGDAYNVDYVDYH